MEGDGGIILEVCGDDKRNLGGGTVLMLMRAGILVVGVEVVVLGVMGLLLLLLLLLSLCFLLTLTQLLQYNVKPVNVNLLKILKVKTNSK